MGDTVVRLTYSAREAAEALGLSVDSIRKMEASGALPRLKKITGCIRFSRKDVLACADLVDQDVRPSQIRQLQADLARERAENERLRERLRKLIIAANQAAVEEGL